MTTHTTHLPQGLVLAPAYNLPPIKAHREPDSDNQALIPATGVFANEYFPVGHWFGLMRVQRSHYLSDGELFSIEVMQRTLLGFVVNCNDEEPSCKSVLVRMEEQDPHWTFREKVHLEALRPIKPGDQLDLMYTLPEHGAPGDRPW